MSSNFKSRIKKSAEIIEPFLQKNFTYSSFKDAESVINSILEDMGIDDTEIGIEVLQECEYEDFVKTFYVKIGATIFFLGKNGIPINSIGDLLSVPRMRLAWKTLKDEKPAVTSINTSIADLLKSNRPIGQWSDIELLDLYNQNCSTEIIDELTKRSKGRYCVIFDNEGKVDVENSLYMLRAARNQETSPTFIIKSTNECKEVLKAGEFPNEFLYECPVHQNILLVNGYCEKCDCLWDVENDKEKNAFIRFIILVNGVNDEVTIRIYIRSTFEQLSRAFPKIFLRFKELKELNQLPIMKRKLSGRQAGDPFRVTTHRTY